MRFKGSEIPYFAFGRAYMRVGATNRQLSAKELENLIIEKHKILWEDGISDKSIHSLCHRDYAASDNNFDVGKIGDGQVIWKLKKEVEA